MRRSRLRLSALSLFVILAALAAVLPAAAEDAPLFDEKRFEGLEWREVGPYRGGRSAAVTGVPRPPGGIEGGAHGQEDVYYFGSTGGGVWKTTDGGRSWKNVSDGFFGGSIGAVAVSEWDPNVVYVGGGEVTVRGNVSQGEGVYRSTDAGKTWKHVGLADTRHIPRIRIHPKDPDLVYVAALGHLFGPNKERGVFRSKDGGATWENVLFVSEEAGAVDLAMDPTNPRILYACFWKVLRTPWSLESGGEGSGIWKSADGGDTWEELTSNPGLPKPPLGISGITVSPTNPENLYAIVEAEEGGVFRSRDAGKTWRKVNSDRSLRQRAWYYSRIYADPADEETVYVVNVRFHRSKDGGRSFRPISTPHGDNHDLWIAPDDPLRMIESNDGGANVSRDGGESWTPQDNQPTAQMYRVSADNDFPYRLLGGQQDNTALRIRSRSTSGAITDRDWEPTAGGESGHIVAKPDDPDVVYGGSYGGFLVRVNHRTEETRGVDVWPDNPMGWGAADLKYRFQWNFPLFYSPHDPNTLYAAAQVLFRTQDGGESWEQLSGDLTRDDKSKMGPSGGVITKDNTSVEYYGTIFAALESPHEPGVLWTGSDDGLIHVSRDDGKTWEDVTPKEMPEWAQVNSIEAHPFEPGGLYVAATRYKLDDFAPYLFRTTDYGKTWKKITGGIPKDHFTRVIRADPGRRGLLYAGTEQGVYVSFDDGASWQTMQTNLPVVPVTDLLVKDGDLVAATQGRGYWILDDLSPLHQLAAGQAEETAHLFDPRPTVRLLSGRGRRGGGNAGTNPPRGVLFTYFLSQEVADDEKAEVSVEILSADGESIRRYTRKPAEGKEEDQRPGRRRGGGEENLRQVPAKAGLNRFAWDLSYPPAEGFEGMILWNGGLSGPVATPGTYKAKLTAGEWSGEVDFEVTPDPRSSATPEELAAQRDFLLGVRDDLTRAHQAIGRLRELRGQVKELEKRLQGHPAEKEIGEATKALEEKLKAIEEALYQTKNQSPQDPLNFPIRLNDKLAGVLGIAGIGVFHPTEQMYAVRDELKASIDAELEKLQAVWDEDVPALNALAAEKAVPVILVPEKTKDEEEKKDDEGDG